MVLVPFGKKYFGDSGEFPSCKEDHPPVRFPSQRENPPAAEKLAVGDSIDILIQYFMGRSGSQHPPRHARTPQPHPHDLSHGGSSWRRNLISYFS